MASFSAPFASPIGGEPAAERGIPASPSRGGRTIAPRGRDPFRLRINRLLMADPAQMDGPGAPDPMFSAVATRMVRR